MIDRLVIKPEVIGAGGMAATGCMASEGVLSPDVPAIRSAMTATLLSKNESLDIEFLRR